MSPKRRNKKRHQLWLLLLVIIILAISGFLVYNNLIPDSDLNLLVPEEGGEKLDSPVIQYQKAEDLELLIRQFEKHGNWPEKPGREGKANPFLPYFGG